MPSEPVHSYVVSESDNEGGSENAMRCPSQHRGTAANNA